MYQITETASGATHFSDTIVEVAWNPNGCYVEADKRHPAQGFCGLIPVTIQQPIYPEDEHGMPDPTKEPIGYEDVNVMHNVVFHYAGQPTMKGGEPNATYVEMQAVPEIMNLEESLEQAYELLYG